MNGVVASRERTRVLNAVPLRNAVLCAECDVVSDSPHDVCMVCGSHSLFNIALVRRQTSATTDKPGRADNSRNIVMRMCVAFPEVSPRPTEGNSGISTTSSARPRPRPTRLTVEATWAEGPMNAVRYGHELRLRLHRSGCADRRTAAPSGFG